MIRNRLTSILGCAVFMAAVTWAALPAGASQPAINITQNTSGAAGYYAADDNHTHFRFTETTVQAEPTLNQLNGALAGTPGAVGTELCDPNTGFTAQTGLLDVAGTYEVLWAYGVLPPNLDPCVQSGLLQPAVNPANCPATFTGATVGGITCGTFTLGPITTGDHVYLGVYYNPAKGTDFKRLSFGDCVTETQICRQTWSTTAVQQEFFEFGTGALTRGQVLTAPAVNLLETFTGNNVTCYSCRSSVPIGEVQTVTGIGGLTEANFINGSAQVVMSPNGSLTPYPSAVNAFSIWNGSTSP